MKTKVPKNTFFAYNIDWDVDLDTAMACLEDRPLRDQAMLMHVEAQPYINAHPEERWIMMEAFLKEEPQAAANLLGLPFLAIIPERFGICSVRDDLQEYTDYLSDQYGFCIRGYQIDMISH